MESITTNPERIGNFTSSEAYKLIPFGSEPMTESELTEYKKNNPKGQKKNKESGFSSLGLTYIQEKNMERKMGLSLRQEVYTRPMAWGDLIEMYVHEKKLSTSYQSVGKKTLNHPTIKCWKGSPDFINPMDKIIAECKGYERKAFSLYADSILLEDVEVLREEHPEEYWQMVSNAIILGFNKIQPILFMPFESELMDLANFAAQIEGIDQWRYKFVFDALENGNIATLPYLKDGGYYNNLITNIYEIPQKDIDLITAKVLTAEVKLKAYYEVK